MKPPELPSAASRARDLREAFDATFALPPPPPPPATTAFVILRAGGERVAVKRAEMSGLVRAGDHVAPVPGRSPAFVGLASLPGGLLPVWRLAALLGGDGGPGTASGDAGWLVLAGARDEATCAFACGGFEQMVFVADSALSSSSPRGVRPGLVPAMLPWDGALVPVVSLPALQAEILRRHPSVPSSPP